MEDMGALILDPVVLHPGGHLPVLSFQDNYLEFFAFHGFKILKYL
jgi:hypothetical protein